MDGLQIYPESESAQEGEGEAIEINPNNTTNTTTTDTITNNMTDESTSTSNGNGNGNGDPSSSASSSSSSSMIPDLTLTAAQLQSYAAASSHTTTTTTSNVDSKKFHITPTQLGDFTREHERDSPRDAYIDLFTLYLNSRNANASSGGGSNGNDVENNGSGSEGDAYIQTLLSVLQKDKDATEGTGKEGVTTTTTLNAKDQEKVAHHLDIASLAVTTILLHSSAESGITVISSTPSASTDGDDEVPSELQHRINIFGSNAISEKKMTPFLILCWEALHDFVLVMLIIMGIVSIVVETTIGKEDGEPCGGCWLEGAAILTSVCIVMLVTAGIDYMKQFAFRRLNRSLEERNTKLVIRGSSSSGSGNGDSGGTVTGSQVVVTDKDIVVGDILSVNSHSLASIPADCILLGPAIDLQMNESSLTGESNPVHKAPGDIILSGTNAIQGSGKMVVVAVGIHSVAGRIKARVYESGDDEEDMEGDDETPLYQKLDAIAKQIAWAGTIAAIFAFAVSAGIGLGHHKKEWKSLIDYFIVAVTVLAVAVPEGLPLAVVLALAFSSNQMMGENNMVKSLDACETMGCATTICTDKTGTLTANQMTARAIYVNGKNSVCDDPKTTLAEFVTQNDQLPPSMVTLLSSLISICTMNETFLTIDLRNRITGSSGNPTEVALLTLVQEMGCDYRNVRNETRGRSDVGAMGEHLHEGKCLSFTSARKMMSWAVPLPMSSTDGSKTYRLYSKGAAEVILARCTKEVKAEAGANPESSTSEMEMDEETSNKITSIAEQYARRGMRCLGLAYKDIGIPAGVDVNVHLDMTSSTIKNSDGTDAFLAETDMVFCSLVGIEDPLRPEVPGAIQKCYEAGIDVRLVTGDSPNTAVSIAYQAGILKKFHFIEDSEMVAENLKPNVLMEGREFRSVVYKSLPDNKKEFDQEAFDDIWPHLRVLARSSPDDKLTLAHGLNQSTLFENSERCAKLLKEDNITIFPDRQVVSMTGDGTNDAPALKRADIGFAMGIAGTQIAKDAADIILIDDNFASIVTAAKWGRNVYASIQKFLQFQLTVNIAAVVTALVGAVAYQKSPLAAIQLLWVNLLMDSLASLALASEPPTEELLKRPPVNRSQHMITSQMWANMLGQSFFQILVTMLLLFLGPQWFNIPPGHEEEDRGVNSIHYTIIFNTFVWMQLFNEVNSRNLNGEVNIFRGLNRNPIFIGILVSTSVLQVLMVELGGKAMHVADGGLAGKYWGLSIGIGALSLPVQQLINVLYRMIMGSKNEHGGEQKYQAVSTNASGGRENGSAAAPRS